MPLMFLSGAFLPKSLLPGWIQRASDWNPYAYMIEGTRVFMTGPFGWGPVGKAVAAAGVLLLLTQPPPPGASPRSFGETSGSSTPAGCLPALDRRPGPGSSAP